MVLGYRTAAFSRAPLIEELEDRIPQWLARYNVPGISVVLVRNDSLVWSQGFGLAEAGSSRPMTGGTICRTGAISESLTAWGVMKLVQRGEVRLDAPIDRYLQRWQLPPSRFDHAEVTVRRLLSHCSGIRRQVYPRRDAPERRPATKALLSGIAFDGTPVHVNYRPGTEFLHSQANYLLLELLIEEVSGMDYAAFMRREVLRPLGMENSYFDWRRTPVRRRAVPHDRRGRPLDTRYINHRAAAGFNSTADDLAAFLTAALPSLRDAVKGSPVLARSLIDLMERPTPLPGRDRRLAPNRRRYGLGYIIERTPDRRTVFTRGGPLAPGWYARFYGVPNTADGLVLLTNGHNGAALSHSIALAWAEAVGVERLPSIAAIRKNRRISWLLLIAGGLAAFALAGFFLRYLVAGRRAFATDRWKQRLLPALFAGGMIPVGWPPAREWLLFWTPQLYPWSTTVAALLAALLLLLLFVPRQS